MAYHEIGLPTSSTNNALVRFSGINGNIIKNSTITATDGGSLVLTGQATQAYTQGQLYYDTDNESITFHNNDSNISLQVGQEGWMRVRNVTGSTITNGTAVYVNGANTGLPTIALAQANAIGTSFVVGLVTESIANNAIGYVTVWGMVNGLNTSGFADGTVLYLSPTTPGALTSTQPVAPNFSVRVGVVALSNMTTGKILVTPQDPAPLQNLVQTASAEVTTDQTTGSATLVDLTGASVTLTTQTGTKLKIDVSFSMSNSSALGSMNRIALVIDGTVVARKNSSFSSPLLSNFVQGGAITHLATGLSSGSHTIKLQWSNTTGTTQCRPTTGAPNNEHASIVVMEIRV